MKNNLENKFYWAARSIAAVVVFGISIVSAQVFIAEITDPQNSSDAGRYVELYNSGSADVDLSTGWQIQRWTNNNADPQTPSDLTGTIPAGGFYIICNDADKFLTTYGFAADQDIGTDGAADSNGDDNIALLDEFGAIHDMFGVAGEDGSGTGHEFEDGRAERVATVTSPNTTWDASEWNIDNDSGGGDGNQFAPEDFDPGAWIGVASEGNNAPVVNAGGDQEVMANATDGTASVTLDGSATVDLDGDAMTYLWTSSDGTEVSNDPTFTTDLAVGTHTFTLTANDGELDGSDDVVITVTPFLNAYAVTFNIDMSEVTVGDDGVQISGLGDANIAMVDDDADGVYTATVDLFEGDHTYNFRNGWGYESGDALTNCATGTFGNDRSVSVVDADIVLDAVCWESCDACAVDPPSGTDVTFTVTDGTESYPEIEFMGTPSDWGVVLMYDDGTNGDEVAGDHVWTVVINVEEGEHEWGAMYDGGWLIIGDNLTFTVADGVVSGQTDYTIEPVDVTANVTFTVVDHTQQIENLMFKGTMSMWAVFQGYDDGTNGDEVAGDHVWTAQYETAAGAHEWGAIDTDNGDGTTCTLCDGSDGWGTWLSGSYENYYFTVDEDGIATGDFNLDVGDPPPAIAGTWKLAPIAGALKVGPGVDDGSWWQNSAEDVTTRFCLFDDEYVFNADGSFQNVLGTETWLEGWQIGDDELEGHCGAPVAPHDGSTTGTWSINETAGTLTLSGTGSYLGLAKATNGGDLGSPAEAPESVTYNILYEEDNLMSVYIPQSINTDTGEPNGYWTFIFSQGDVDLGADVVTACHPNHIENGYLDNFFGVSPELEDEINPGDILTITQGDQTHPFTVAYTTYTNDENCIDENGMHIALYVFIDGDLSDAFGESLMIGSTFTNEPPVEDVMVTLWLEAYDVPCDGNPYVAGSFNDWNATDIEMTYDDYHEEYWVELHLPPGSYEYKFVCYNWSNQEDVPEECNDGNGDEYSNRLIVVPENGEENWIDADLTSWSGCPDPDPCDLVDCNNLQFVGVLGVDQVDAIIDILSGEGAGFTADSVFNMIAQGWVNMAISSSLGEFEANFMPEYSDPEDSIFVYFAETPPLVDSVFHYWWHWDFEAYGLVGNEWHGFQDLEPGSEGAECLTVDENMGFNTRYWDPADWEEELYLLSVGDEDIEPTDIWNVDLYGSCEYGSAEPPETSGCTDPSAINYDSEATVDDGSCDYPEPVFSHNVEFSDLADMIYDRYYHAHTSDGSYLYALGGWSAVYEMNDSTGMMDTNYVRLGNAERYDPATDIWEIITEDLIPRTRGDAVYHDGSIYIFGGKIDDPVLGDPYDSWTKTVEVLDLESGEITLLPESLPYEGLGVDHAAHAIWDGKIYLWGGDEQGLENDFGGRSEKLHSFDISTGEWTRLADYPENVETFEGVAADGKIYSFGGYKGGGETSRNIYAYDVENDQWNFLDEMPAPISTHRVVYDGGANKIIVVGDYANIEYVGVFDLDNQQYKDAGTQNMLARRRPAAEFMNGGLYTFGGGTVDFTGNHRDLQRGWIDYYVNEEEPSGCTDPYAINYDPNALVDDGSCEFDEVSYEHHIEFEDLADMNIARYAPAHTTDDSYIYAISGMTREIVTNDTTGLLDTLWFRVPNAERYDPMTDTWEIFAENLVARRYADAEYVNENIYVFGGSSNYGISDTVEIINVETGAVSYDTSPFPVSYGASAEWDGKIYIWGGDTEEGRTDRLYSYDPMGQSWTRLADIPDSLAAHEGIAADGFIYSFGGYVGGGNVVKDIYAYDIEMDTWSHVGETNNGASSHSVAYDADEGKVVLTGDYGNLDYAGVFDLNTRDFDDAQTNNMVGRRHSASVFMGGHLYTFGGAQYGGWNDNPDYIPLSSMQRGWMHYDVNQEPEPTITSYTYQTQTLDSYNNGEYATTILPLVDVNDGLHTIATFDTVGIDGPYVGLYALFYDSNLNGQLDSTDYNVLEWSDDFGNDENVMLLVDNGPQDMNPEVGVYESILLADSPEGGFLKIQGANYFMTAINPNYTISGYEIVSPVSGSTTRVTGMGTMPDPDTGEPVGVGGMNVSIWDWYSYDQIGAAGVTGLDGSYDIGVDLTEETLVFMTAGEAYTITDRYLCVFENGGYDGYSGDTWTTVTLGPDGYVQDFDVIKMNTLVHGQVTDQNGSPVGGAWLDVSWNYNSIDDYYYNYYGDVFNVYLDADDEGYYSFWGMNGETFHIYANDSLDNYSDYDEDVNIFSETYDDYIDGYYFNHDIVLMDQPVLPPTDLLYNNSFEDWYQGYDWNRYAEDYYQWPTSHNTHIELTGGEIYGSEETFTAYDGDASLKMWGQYNNDGVDNTTSYYQGLYGDYYGYYYGETPLAPGTVIHASAMMMSHPGDWIGGGSGLNNGEVFVSYFDYSWNFIGGDLSEPMDTSDAAGEWHHRSVESVVPDGAFYINMGVQYNQVHGSDGMEGHGSIFYDMVEAFVSASDVQTVTIYGYTEQDEYDENGEYIGTAPLPNATIHVWNENYFIEVVSDENGWWTAEVPENQSYYVTGAYFEGFYESSFEEVYACDDYYYDYYDYYDYDYDYCDNQVTIHFTHNSTMWFEVQGQVTDGSGNPMYNAQVVFDRADSSDFRRYVSYTDYMGFFQDNVPHGAYNVHVGMNGFMVSWDYGVEVTQHNVFLDISLEPAEFTGAVQGVVVLHGNPPDGQIHLNFWNDEYDAMGTTNENGFFNIPLVDGVYKVWADAPGYSGFYQEDAFEIVGNTVTFNIDLYEHGFAAAPQIVDLHDVPNDQGRQMRSVWNSGIPGDWGFFTQYSIWRKVNGAPIELWDYVETVPWHGMDDPYAVVLPTLGDSSMNEMHESTFMVTAHTEDVNIWFDSQPASGYSIDNLHPGAPMSLMYTHSGGTISLNWSGPEDGDFSHHNIYRQEITSADPATVFTTVDSFYVDQDVTDAGAYEYWITAVDLSGLESEPSNSVAAVLSADENLGLPTEFALRQNYPNPFNPSTQIQYALPEETRVTISIYDLMGRKVRTLVNDVQDAGYRSVMWNATNDMGRLVSAGVYIYSIQAGDFIQNRKMVLMK